MAIALITPTAWAITPDDPEVRELVDKALHTLESSSHPFLTREPHRIGGQSLVGLAFLKAGKRDHSRVHEAVATCRAGMSSGEEIDMYSNGLAIIFLCELDSRAYRNEIKFYLNMLANRQKGHGGWGYEEKSTGDTSQTQYGTLAYWSAYRAGMRIQSDSVEHVTDWLLRTQDPSGVWGYQGTVATGANLVTQSGTSPSMLAAGLGSLLICVDLLGIKPNVNTDEEAPQVSLPPALRRSGDADESKPVPLAVTPTEFTSAQVMQAIQRANVWMDENFTYDMPHYTAYYLYSMERYKSFQELFDGIVEEEPEWYNGGVEYLRRTEKKGGGWRFGLGSPIDTAFCTLFLLRSTQKSIQGKISEGMLVAGRGLPSNLARAKVRHGQIIVEQVQTEIDGLLAMIDDDDKSALDDLVNDPSYLVVEDVDQRAARRLKQLARGGEPTVRVLAVRALARTGNLDHVPTLLFALTDPDPRVVREARDGLRFVSRRFEGFGLPDRFTEAQRAEAVTKWKQWYGELRPDIPLEP